MKRTQILLDMDGVLVDFLSGAIKVLNKDFEKDITLKQYADDFGKWGTYDYYGITQTQFWKSIDNTKNFWYNLPPIPWYKELYAMLEDIGDVTIVTTPNLEPSCAMQKIAWLLDNMNITSDKVFLGARKYLFAGNGILIDDYEGNTSKFIEAGGEAILIPSNWNDSSLTFEKVKNIILGRK